VGLQDERAKPRFFSIDPNKLEFLRPYRLFSSGDYRDISSGG
jgi:hypothetical protein